MSRLVIHLMRDGGGWTDNTVACGPLTESTVQTRDFGKVTCKLCRRTVAYRDRVNTNRDWPYDESDAPNP